MASNARSTEGHYRRLRERFLTNGLEGFLDYEVVELLLKLADPRPDHKPTAKAMMAKFGSIGGVLEAAPVLLKSIGGVGDKNIFGLKLVQAVAGRYLKEAVVNKDYIQSSDQVLSYLVHHFKNRNREQFMIILLNGRNQIIEKVAPHRETKVRIRSVSGNMAVIWTLHYFSSSSSMESHRRICPCIQVGWRQVWLSTAGIYQSRSYLLERNIAPSGTALKLLQGIQYRLPGV